MKNVTIFGIIALLLLKMVISGCTSTSAKPSCPVCNSTDNVVSFTDRDNQTDFQCTKCESTHYNKTGSAVPEPGWNIAIYKEKVTGWKLINYPNEIVFIGDSGKQYTESQT